jgi:hypothetical protein
MTQDAHQPLESDLTSLLDLSTLPDDPRVLKQLLTQVILLRPIQRKYLRRDVDSGNNKSNREQPLSSIASCKMNNVEPFAYLVDVLRRLPTTPREQLVDLLSHRGKLSTAPRATPAGPTATT